MRVVFMGTPDFAAASLAALLEAGFEIPCVFTQPDRPRDRGMKPAFSPVKTLACSAGLPVHQPDTLRGGEAENILAEARPDVLAVVAYGRMLPDAVLALPKYGAVNVHASLLPKYRGAAPIQWAVLNGDTVTGVSTMYLAHDMDTGDIIYQEKTEIGEFETSGELFDRLAPMGARLLVRTLRDMAAGTAPRVPQDPARASYVGPLDKALSPIDWNAPARQVVKHIYGLQPWPVATAELGGTVFRIWAAEYGAGGTEKAPGTVVSAGRQGIEVACAGGESVMITALQAPGKKRVRAADWLLGHSLPVS